MDAGTVRGWSKRFDELVDRVGPCFGRHDLRSQASGYLRGLLGSVERKNSWQLSEHLGRDKPYGIQRLLGRASWDADQVRDELIRYAADHLVSPGDRGVLIIDETGFLKKGTKSVGVQRQYSGTAGRIENCQIGVFLALSTSRGRALVDRALYLPKAWCSDAPRREEAGVPEGMTFATKPQLAVKMLDHAFAAGLRPEFVLADEVYGNDRNFRRFLENRKQPFVVAVKSSQYLWAGFRQRRVDKIAADMPADAWFRMSVGEGAKGPRVYDWAAAKYGFATEKGLIRWLLIRRNIGTGERAYYLCAALKRTTAKDLVTAAGQRWAIEVCFETAKQETGLDEYEVRSWDGWHRHITLSMFALAFLTVVRSAATSPKRPRSKSAVTSSR
ncbi:MAG TPA: IS701 family transposase [Phycisphaerae bacterium]|nr:IS701 family transposase [Phycisphaerae bacterium]HRY71243.1 IS701 family transposase [Phycisphaerae bacterium]HSA29611.1 IS701 family transposase [Phycisphaerae bacterium]